MLAPTIGIIGAGILSPNHLTLESDRFLRESGVIFHLLESGEDMAAYLQSLGRPLVDLADLYEDGALDYVVYRRIAETVLAAAQSHAKVALLVPGHPLILVSPTALIAEACARAGINVVILPGISSLDTMILQLNLEIGSNGVQVFEANRFIYYDIRPDPRVPLFLLQPGGVGTGVITRSQLSLSSRFEPLKNALMKTYAGGHECLLLTSQTLPGSDGRRQPVQIQNLPNLAHDIDYDMSLFVPPSQGFRVVNTNFYERLPNPRHAETLLNQ